MIFGYCRYSPRHPVVPLYVNAVPSSPLFLSACQGKTAKHIGLFLLIIIKDINCSLVNCRTCMTLSKVNRPELLRPLRSPPVGKRHFIGADVVGAYTPESRPAPGYTRWHAIESLGILTDFYDYLGYRF